MENLKLLRTLSVLSILAVLLFVKVSPDKGFVIPYAFLFIGMFTGDVGGYGDKIFCEFIFYLTPLLALIPYAGRKPAIWLWIPLVVTIAYLANNLNSQIYLNVLSLIPFWLFWQYILRKRNA